MEKVNQSFSNYCRRVIMWLVKTVVTIYLTIFILGFLGVVSLIVFVMMLASNVEPHQLTTLEENSYLELSFPTPVGEKSQVSFSLSDFNKSSMNFYELTELVNVARENSHLKGIYLDLNNWSLTSQQTLELGDLLEQFKLTGKKVIAYGTDINNLNYQIAIHANVIAMPPTYSANFNLTGYNIAIPYYKGFLDKIGVEMKVIHIGDFKSFGENFHKSKMSYEYRSELNKVFNELKRIRIKDITELRGVASQAIFDSQMKMGKYALLNPYKALEKKLITEIGYKENVINLHFPDMKAVTLERMRHLVNSKTIFNHSQNLALLVLDGDIMMDLGVKSPFGDQYQVTPGNVKKSVDKILAKPGIKGVVVRVNSPGGSALASELILQEINRLKSVMPVYVSMGDVAASGGYYISSSATKIFANPTTITGSIGVVSMIPDFSKMGDKLGLKFELINGGRFSDLNNLMSPFTADKEQAIRKSMKGIYSEFLERVATGRSIDTMVLHNRLAQGLIWTGSQAVKNKLIDELGGLQYTIEKLGAELKINPNVIVYPEKEDIFSIVSKMNIESEVKLNLPELENLEKNIKRCRSMAYRPILLLPETPTINKE